MKRRQCIQALATLAGTAILAGPIAAQTKPQVEVWKDPDCGCCKDWVKHLESNGFTVKVHDSGNAATRTRLGIPDKLGSCHTAQVGGYAIEGHVPARDIQRLLKEKPQAVGLAVPGMPVGSPGMDLPIYGKRRDPYDVLLISKSGASSVYQSYNRT
ncbi:MAG: DUF411 domain-containing protein [Pseudomonadota bacterium]